MSVESAHNSNQPNDGDDDNDKTQMANNLIKAIKSLLICSIHKRKKVVCFLCLLSFFLSLGFLIDVDGNIGGTTTSGFEFT